MKYSCGALRFSTIVTWEGFPYMIARFYNDDSRRPIGAGGPQRAENVCARRRRGILPAVPALVRSGGRFGERAGPNRRHLAFQLPRPEKGFHHGESQSVLRA